MILKNKKKFFAVVVVSIHGMNSIGQMETRASLDMLSLIVAKRLVLNLEGSSEKTTVANECRAVMKGEVANVFVILKSLKVETDFTFLQNISFDPAVGSPTLERMDVGFDFRTEEVRLHNHI